MFIPFGYDGDKEVIRFKHENCEAYIDLPLDICFSRNKDYGLSEENEVAFTIQGETYEFAAVSPNRIRALPRLEYCEGNFTIGKPFVTDEDIARESCEEIIIKEFRCKRFRLSPVFMKVFMEPEYYEKFWNVVYTIAALVNLDVMNLGAGHIVSFVPSLLTNQTKVILLGTADCWRWVSQIESVLSAAGQREAFYINTFSDNPRKCEIVFEMEQIKIPSNIEEIKRNLKIFAFDSLAKNSSGSFVLFSLPYQQADKVLHNFTVTSGISDNIFQHLGNKIFRSIEKSGLDEIYDVYYTSSIIGEDIIYKLGTKLKPLRKHDFSVLAEFYENFEEECKHISQNIEVKDDWENGKITIVCRKE